MQTTPATETVEQAKITGFMKPGEAKNIVWPKVFLYRRTRFPFDPHRIVYTTPKPTSHGGFVVHCQYALEGELADGTKVKTLAPVVLQTPVMTTTFGMSTKKHEGDKIRGTVDVTFYENGDQSVADFRDVLAIWDSLLLAKAKKEKKKWFRSDKVSDAILDYLYNSMLRKNTRKSDGKQFSDSFRCKIPRRTNRFDAEVYNTEQQPISLDEITRMSSVRIKAHHTGIWFGEQMFVSSFEAQQIQKMAEGRTTGFGFAEEDPTNTEGGAQQPAFEFSGFP